MEKEVEITNTEAETFLLDISEIYAGCYQIGTNHSNVRFNLMTKPKWLHRKFCELLLGWKWIDK